MLRLRGINKMCTKMCAKKECKTVVRPQMKQDFICCCVCVAVPKKACTF